MKAFVLDSPRGAAVVTRTESHGGGGGYETRAAGVSAYLVNVSIDVDGGMPGDAAVARARDAAHVDVCEEHRAVGSRRHGADSQRRAHAYTVDDRRTGIPSIAPGNRVEAA